LMAGYVCFL